MVRLCVLLTHQYRLLSVAATLDVFESVNRFYIADGKPAFFDISLIYTDDSINDRFRGYHLQHLNKTPKQDLILVPAFSQDQVQRALTENSAYYPWLKEQYETGAEIASFCTGAFLLGASGLLNGKAATTHMDSCPAFAVAFPAVKLQPDKIVTGEARLYTSGGATSSFHLMLHLLQRHCGKDIAIRTAKLFAIDMDRNQQSYFANFAPSQDHSDELVAMAQQNIEAAYHEAGTIEDMIRNIPASRRNIARRFKQFTGITPIEYLQKTRIEAAKKLLEQTNKQMTEVMLHSGYNDPKAFRKIFRKVVGLTPTGYREKFQAN